MRQYSQKIVFQLLKQGESIERISEETHISVGIIEEWVNQKELSKHVSSLINEKKYNEAISICKRFPGRIVFQSQLIDIYIKQGDYNLAMIVGKKFPHSPIIQAQMITCYCRLRDFSEAEDIVEKNPNINGALPTLIKGYNRELYEIERIVKGKDGDNNKNIYARILELRTVLMDCKEKPFSEIRETIGNIRDFITEFYEKEKENGR